MIARLLLAVSVSLAAAGAAMATTDRPSLRVTAQPAKPVLKTDVTATRDILTLGDLVNGLPAAVAAQPAFRAPALGETGTIQTTRIVEAVRAQGVADVSDGGAAQVVVTRAARRIGIVDIEAAVRRGIEERFGVDVRGFSLSLENGAPMLAIEPELRGAVQAQDLVYDPRSRRVAATLMLPGSAALRLKPVRVTGQLVETADVIVPVRNINRGEIVQAGDIMIERRPREGLPADMVSETTAVVGKAARRPLSTGLGLRASDLQRQEIVARNEIVTVVYEAPGLSLTMRARAQEAGAQGDIISVQNMQSKKILQATVTGAGRVAVNGVASARIAVAN